MTTQSKSPPVLTEQTTQLYIQYVTNGMTTQPKQNKLYSLYKTVLNVLEICILFSEPCKHRKEGTTKKSIQIKSKTKSECPTLLFRTIYQ